MAKRDDTTKPRSGRTRINKVAPKSPTPSKSIDSLKEAIENERQQLMQAHAVVKTLSAALMNAEDDEAMYYVDTANVAADLIDEAVGKLNGTGVKEPAVAYVIDVRPMLTH